MFLFLLFSFVPRFVPVPMAFFLVDKNGGVTAPSGTVTALGSEVDALRRNGLRFASDGRLVVDETAEVASTAWIAGKLPWPGTGKPKENHRKAIGKP